MTGNFDYIDTRDADRIELLGWQTIEQRRDYFTANLMYKIIHENAPNARVTPNLRPTYDQDFYQNFPTLEQLGLIVCSSQVTHSVFLITHEQSQ